MSKAANTDQETSNALKAIASGGQFDELLIPFTHLLDALDLHGYRLCLASGNGDQLKVIFFFANGPLARLGGAVSGENVDCSWPLLGDCLRTRQVLSWTSFLDGAEATCATSNDTRQMLASQNITAGVSVPVFSKSFRLRASVCATGRPGEDPRAFDERVASLWPYLRLAGLALFEAAVVEAQRAAADTVTSSEHAVLSALERGLRVKDIAAELGKTEGTIRNQMESARLRLEATTTVQAVATWIKTRSPL